MHTSDTNGGVVPEVEEGDIRDITGEAVVEKERHRRGRAGVLAVILSLVAFTATLTGLTFGYLHWSRVEASLMALDDSIVAANQRTDELGSGLARTQAAFEAQRTRLNLQQALLEQQQQQLQAERDRLLQEGTAIKSALQAVNSRIGSSGTNWMVSEAEYLLAVANYRLKLDRDPQTALLALQAADERLLGTGDPEWEPVREMLRGDIDRLREHKSGQRGVTEARIAGLAEQVGRLRMLGMVRNAALQESDQSQITAPGERSLKTLLSDGWEGFKSIMVIRQHGQSVSAAPPPEQQAFIYQNMRLQLAAAQLSLFYENQGLYRTSLQTVGHWLAEYFDQDDPDTRTFTNEIAELEAVYVVSELPDISSTLAALRDRAEQLRAGGAGG